MRHIFLSFLVLLLLPLAAHTATAQQTAAPGDALDELRLPVQQKQEKTRFALNGQLQYRRIGQVASDYEGFAEKLLHQKGDEVRRGDRLVRFRLDADERQRLEPRSINPAIPRQELQVSENEIKLRHAQREMADIKELVDAGLASATQLRQIEEQVELARMELDLARRELEDEKKKLQRELESLAEELGVPKVQEGRIPEYIHLTAPFSGRVIWQRNINSKRRLPPQAKIVEVAAADPMLIKTRVYEDTYRRLNANTEAECTLKNRRGPSFKAFMHRLPLTPTSKKVNEASYYDVFFKTANPDMELKEGYKVKLVISLEPKKGGNRENAAQGKDKSAGKKNKKAQKAKAVNVPDLTGTWESSYFLADILIEVKQKRDRIRGKVVISRLIGGDNSYHFRGRVTEDGSIEASHTSGHTFSGKLTARNKGTGVLTTKNGTTLNITGKRTPETDPDR